MYLFLLLPLVYLIIFKYIPMAGVQIAFRQYSARLGIWHSKWVGMKQFSKFLNSYQFERVFFNTLRLALYSLVAGFPLPIILALLLNTVRSKKYRSFIENVTYMPYFISTVVIVGILTQVFNTRVGLFAMAYRALTGSPDVPDLLASASAFPHMYVWSGIWQSTGWGTVIYMAALSGVDPEQHEAAVIDGASRFKQTIHITLPGILPTIMLVTLLNIGGVMNANFDQVYNLYSPTVYASGDVLDTLIYRIGLVQTNYSMSTAVSLFKSVVSMGMVGTCYYLAYRFAGYRIF